jgi:hypothetical protein
MPSKNNELEDEIINNLLPNYLYSHEFEEGRFFQTVAQGEEGVTFKVSSKTFLKVVYIHDKNDIEGFEIVKIIGNEEKQRIKFSKFNLAQVKFFLEFICQLDLPAICNKRLKIHDINTYSNKDLIGQFNDLLNEALTHQYFQEWLDKGLFLAKDLVNTGYRKSQLIIYQQLLDEPEYWKIYCKEKAWQHFFSLNSWIFGYGLDYRFMSILQKEAHISDQEIDGTNGIIADFLLGDKRFTTFVEIKKPSTKIFGSNKNRGNSWCLSNDLTYALSQILEQKVSGQIKLDRGHFAAGEPIKQNAYDSKVILIFGHWAELSTDSSTTLEREIKRKTFELFRRDSRNVEIITFDELFDRAKYIVEGIDT